MEEIESLPQNLYEVLVDFLPEDFKEFGFYAAYTGEGSYGMSLLAKLNDGGCKNCFAELSAQDTFFLFEDLDGVISKVRNSIKKEEDSPLKMITREYYRDIYNLKENSEVIKLVEAVSAEEINSVAKMIEKKFSVIVKEVN